MTMERRPLIIAYGNDLREDDGVSFAVLDRVVEQSSISFQSMREPQLDLEFSEAISRSSLVVFVDAAAHGEPGHAEMSWVEPNEDEVIRSHDCSPSALLAYTKVVNGVAPRGALVTVVGESFNFSESLSPAAQSGVGPAADMIASLLETETVDLAV